MAKLKPIWRNNVRYVSASNVTEVLKLLIARHIDEEANIIDKKITTHVMIECLKKISVPLAKRNMYSFTMIDQLQHRTDLLIRLTTRICDITGMKMKSGSD